MECPVEIVDASFVATDQGLFVLLEQRSQLVEAGRCQSFFGKIGDEIQFDGFADFVDLPKKRPVDLANAGAAIGEEDDEAFALQLLQGVPDRYRTGAIALD